MANWMMDNLVPWFVIFAVIFAALVVMAASTIVLTTLFHAMLLGECF